MATEQWIALIVIGVVAGIVAGVALGLLLNDWIRNGGQDAS